MEPMELLKEIGLSKVQAKIYLELLALKKARVMDIHRETKIARSNIYHNLEKLKKQKLVREVTEGKQKFFRPENPRLLLQIFSEKEKLAKDLAHEIGEEENGKVKKPIRIYNRYSVDGHKLIWNQVLKNKDNNLVEFCLYETWKKFSYCSVGRKEVISYKKIAQSRKIKFRNLTSKQDFMSYILDFEWKMFRQKVKRELMPSGRCLPEELHFFVDIACVDTHVNIYGPYIEDYLLNIESLSMSSFYRRIFNYFWKRSKKPEEIEEIKNLMVTGGGIEPPT